MRVVPTSWLAVTWPRYFDETQAEAAMRSLHALTPVLGRDLVVVEVVATTSDITYRLRLPTSRVAPLRRLWTQALPGIAVETIEVPALTIDRARSVRFTPRSLPLDADHREGLVSRMIGALDGLGRDEQLLIQCWVGHGPAMGHTGGPASVVPQQDDSSARRSRKIKAAFPRFVAGLRVGVQADGRPRQQQLLGQIGAVLGTAVAPGVRIQVNALRPKTMWSRTRPLTLRSVFTTGELVGLLALPIGKPVSSRLPRTPSRPVAPEQSVARRGRILGDASFPGVERPLALSVSDSLRHLHVLGPTGVGKSTLLANLIVQDMQAGRGLLLIDPKADLVDSVLARIPEDRIDDVVVLDAADLSRPVGINPLAGSGEPTVRADAIVSVMRDIYASSWGPRTSDMLLMGLGALGSRPGSSLADLPKLFSDEDFRREVLRTVDDPVVAGPFWSWFSGIKASEQAAIVAPPLNKIRAFLGRPHVQGVVGQPAPRFDMSELFTKRRIVLVSLPSGQLGAEATSLLEPPRVHARLSCWSPAVIAGVWC